MTTTDCIVTLASLDDHTDLANPRPFREPLPPSRPGHYWALAVQRFAKSQELKIHYPLDNLTPEITITGPELRMLLVDAFGDDHPFLVRSDPYLSSVYRYRVYAEDF